MKYIILKIIKVLSCIFILLLLTIPISNLFENASDSLRKSNDEQETELIDNNIQETELIDKDIIESDQKELQIEKKQVNEVVEEKKPIIENKKSTTSTTSTQNNTKQENNNIKIDTTSSTLTNNNVEVHEEMSKQETKQETNNVNQYIGVPNPNDFYYSFHHGKIEYSNMDSCLADVPRISFKDTIDIINTWCIDVVDGQGTILGQYLYINCSSGNCDKYK